MSEIKYYIAQSGEGETMLVRSSENWPINLHEVGELFKERDGECNENLITFSLIGDEDTLAFPHSRKEWDDNLEGKTRQDWDAAVEEYLKNMRFGDIKEEEQIVIMLANGETRVCHYERFCRQDTIPSVRDIIFSESGIKAHILEIKWWHSFEYLWLLNWLAKYNMQKEIARTDYVLDDLLRIVDLPIRIVMQWLLEAVENEDVKLHSYMSLIQLDDEREIVGYIRMGNRYNAEGQFRYLFNMHRKGENYALHERVLVFEPVQLPPRQVYLAGSFFRGIMEHVEKAKTTSTGEQEKEDSEEDSKEGETP